MGLFDNIKAALGIKSPLEQQYIGDRVECALPPCEECYELLGKPPPHDYMDLQKKYWIKPGVECQNCDTLLYLQSGMGMIDSLNPMRPCPKCGGSRFVVRKLYAKRPGKY